MNKMSLPQIDDAIAAAKYKYLRDTIAKLKEGGASEDSVVLYRHATEMTLTSFCTYVLVEMREIMDKVGGEA